MIVPVVINHKSAHAPNNASLRERVRRGVFMPSSPISCTPIVRELRGKVGDGVNQAADLISATASIPSLNFIPLTTFGNWF